MSFDRAMEQRFVAVSFLLNVAVERATLKALKSLGLKACPDGLQLAEVQRKEKSPLYVKTILLRGRTCRDMYDDHPGYAYFYTDDFQAIKAPPYCPMSRAMQISLRLLQEAQEEINHDEERDGLFIASSIVLLDQFGDAIQEYVERDIGNGKYTQGWLDVFPDESEWAAMEERAKALDSEGSIESGWDNFETGRELHSQAEALRRQITMAKARQRVIY